MEFYRAISLKLLLTALCLLLGWSGLAAQSSQRERRRILIVNSEGILQPLIASMNASVARTLKEDLGADTEIFVEWLDTNRFGSAVRFDQLAETWQAKYATLKLDGIIAMTEPPLHFLAKNREHIFPGVPIVHMTVRESAAVEWNQKPGVYGATVDYDPGAMIALINRAHPKVKRMVIITGISPMDRGWEVFLRERAGGHAAKIKFEFWTGLPMEELLSRCAGLEDDAVIYTPGVHCDGNGEWMIGIEAIKKIQQASRRPVYSPFGEIVIEVGALGGIGPDFSALGPQAARILSKVLHGRADEVKDTQAPQQGYFNWPELRRWRIKESDLPPGSVVLHRVPGFLELYWPWVAGGAVIILMQSAFITALLVQRRQRRLAEAALAEHRQQLIHLTRVSMLSELSGTLTHEFSQPLSSMLNSARAAQRFAEQQGASGEIMNALQNALHAGKRAASLLERLRAMIRREAPKREIIDINDLVAETMKLMRSEFSARQVVTEARLSGEKLPLSGDRVQIQQVLVNVLYNACEAMSGQPADCRKLDVFTEARPDGKGKVTITDHGKGLSKEEKERIFDPFFTTKPGGLGLGMAICRQIVEEHGGSIQMDENKAGQGVTVTVMLPLSL